MYFDGIKISGGAYPFIILCIVLLAIGAICTLKLLIEAKEKVEAKRKMAQELKEERRKEREYNIAQREKELSVEVISKRNDLRPAIHRWVAQTMGRDMEAHIASWYFDMGETDILRVCFDNFEKPVLGTITYNKVGNEYRITLFKWVDESGKIHYIPGERLPKRTSENWTAYFVSELSAPERINYLNGVAEKILSSNKAKSEINIPECFGISLEKYQQDWDENKVNGFADAISKDFEIESIDFDKGILYVALKEI